MGADYILWDKLTRVGAGYNIGGKRYIETKPVGTVGLDRSMLPDK